MAVFFLTSLSLSSSSSVSFSNLAKYPNFESNITLYGDAKVVNGRYAIQLTRSVGSSSGRVMFIKPIKLVEGKPQKLVSFTTYFTFSLSTVNGDGLAFVMVPSTFRVQKFCNCSFGLPLKSENGKTKVVAVKFNTLKDLKNESLVKVHVGIDVGNLVSTKESNSQSIFHLGLKSGNKLSAWIDYEAGSKRLEVRLSQFGDIKPSDSLLWYPIDMSKMWKDEKAFIGLSTSNVNSNSSQTCFLYSWSFEQRHVPQWMHSEPLDPKIFAKNSKPEKAKKGKDCAMRVVAAMIFGIACGALAAFIVLYTWTIHCTRSPVMPEEYVVQQSVDFEYKKVQVLVDKAIEDGKQ